MVYARNKTSGSQLKTLNYNFIESEGRSDCQSGLFGLRVKAIRTASPDYSDAAPKLSGQCTSFMRVAWINIFIGIRKSSPHTQQTPRKHQCTGRLRYGRMG